MWQRNLIDLLTQQIMKFKKTKKDIHVGYNPGEKYLAQLVKYETISFKTMAQMIEKSSTVSRGDIMNVMDSMMAQTLFMLKAGHPVKYDGFGTFHIKTKVKAMNTPEEVTASTIESIAISFLPDKEARDDMKTVSISIDDIEEIVPPVTP
ncbi:MAG: domain fused to wHTH, Ig, or Glycine-rich motif [Bacteroidetes bacterium]|nr:domain fused to wHTH, Ig, or Glycine-rich motif [Bacteroidota bacterium]